MTELTPKEKRRIYEEERERAKAQKKIQSKTKPGTWGCLILIITVGIIWLSGVFSPSKKQVASPKPTVQVKKAVPQITQKDEELLRKLIDAGLVEKINPQLNEVFVNPLVWASLKYEAKKDFAGFLAVYCGKKKGSGVNRVDIKNSYTGKKLAKCSDLGFKVY